MVQQARYGECLQAVALPVGIGVVGSAGAYGDNEWLFAVSEPGRAGRKLHQHLPIGKAIVKLASLALLCKYYGFCRHDRQRRFSLDQRIALSEQSGKGIGILEYQRLVWAQCFASRQVGDVQGRAPAADDQLRGLM
ncbi:hypothetical protein D3C76_991510 [compost metagenome]